MLVEVEKTTRRGKACARQNHFSPHLIVAYLRSVVSELGILIYKVHVPVASATTLAGRR